MVEGSRKKNKWPKPFPSYVDLMCDLINKEPTYFEVVVQNKEWVEAMMEEYQSLLKNGVWEVVPKP